jgi:membrane protein DedA with SNARE-associated domain
MPHFTLETLTDALIHYGYWALMAVLLLESAGLPLPGETILLLASFLASTHRGLYLPYIILTAIFAAVLGDNIGFLIGTHGGQPLLARYGKLFHLTEDRIVSAERRLAQHGATFVFGSRFLAGVRVIAGPLAGALHMPWPKFALFNLLGATVWVITISTVGYEFGSKLHLITRYTKHLEEAVALGLLIFWIYHWYHRKKSLPKQDSCGTIRN